MGLLIIASCIHDKSRSGHVLGNLYHDPELEDFQIALFQASVPERII